MINQNTIRKTLATLSATAACGIFALMVMASKNIPGDPTTELQQERDKLATAKAFYEKEKNISDKRDFIYENDDLSKLQEAIKNSNKKIAKLQKDSITRDRLLSNPVVKYLNRGKTK